MGQIGKYLEEFYILSYPDNGTFPNRIRKIYKIDVKWKARKFLKVCYNAAKLYDKFGDTMKV